MWSGRGISAGDGIAIGKIYVYRERCNELPASCGDPDAEQEKFNQARDQARAELQTLLEEAQCELGQDQAMIFDVQILMLDDSDFIESVRDQINSGCSAAEAVQYSGDTFSAIFAAMDDPYMGARAADVRDMARRLVRILCGQTRSFQMESPGILVAEDLTPSETVRLPKNKVLAFVTRQGSSSSHTAILARTMGVPALVQAEISLDDNLNGQLMIVDSSSERFWVDPDRETLSALSQRQEAAENCTKQLERYRGRTSVTRGGKQIKLFANIGSAADVQRALDGDAEGIGLLRSEFLYLGRDTFPTEEELYTTYRQVIEKMGDRRVIIRTLDVGADKQADYLGLEPEENPALGLRGIRVCLERDEIFRTQLRAICRAAACGSVSVMFPMIASVWEVRQAKARCAQVCAELKDEMVPYRKPELGIMIETPAAALISDQLAQEVDFFSVGTNDLTQYTLATDRQNAKVARYADPHHPAVLMLMEMIVRNAHQAGIWAGICGELGADPTLTETWLNMGYDELSVAPSHILNLRKSVCESEVS